MRETVKALGMILKSSPVGEHDKRVVILTREYGKITAFARGAKRPGNHLMAASRPFAFGEFELVEGKTSYNLMSAHITNYFAEMVEDVECTCYGSYFLEFADYYGREQLDGSELLLLLYQTMRALLNHSIPNSLVKTIFELRAMVINGEYTEKPPRVISDSGTYAWEYIIATPVERLYNFLLTEEVEKQLTDCVSINRKKYIDQKFYSLDILDMMIKT